MFFLLAEMKNIFWKLIIIVSAPIWTALTVQVTRFQIYGLKYQVSNDNNKL